VVGVITISGLVFGFFLQAPTDTTASTIINAIMAFRVIPFSSKRAK
jgi:hypothetical protein